MAIFYVATNAELLSAFNSASGGDEIAGAAGANLGNLSIYGRNFTSFVRFTSADPGNKCSLSVMSINNSSYIDIDGVALIYTFQVGDSSSYRPFQILGCNNIKLRNCVNTGGMDANGYGTGEGLFWRNTTDYVDEDNYTTGYLKADNHMTCSRGSIRRNEFFNITGDGMTLAEVQDLDIENNYIHDHFANPADTFHRDGIQVHSHNMTIPCKRINIRHNRIDMGDGDWTQGIFFNNEAVNTNGAGIGMVHQDITIEENLIYCRHHHGITVASVHNLTVRKNSVLQVVPNLNLAHNASRTPGTEDPQIDVSGQFCSGITIDSNVTTGIYTTAGYTVTNNVIVDVNQGQDYTGSYENLKTVSGTLANPVPNRWTVKVGGAVDLQSAGVTDMTAAGNGGGSGPMHGTIAPPILATMNVPVNISVN